MLPMPGAGPADDAYKQILYANRSFHHSQHAKSTNLCLMTKLTLILTLNDPHHAKPDPLPLV